MGCRFFNFAQRFELAIFPPLMQLQGINNGYPSLKKKKKNTNSGNPPNKARRLARAPKWLSIYPGKKLVRGYAKHFHVDLLCAITDLRLLGVAISDEYEKSIRQNIEARTRQKQKKKEAVEMPEDFGYLDTEYYPFIVNFTSDGPAFGLGWKKDSVIPKKEAPDYAEDHEVYNEDDNVYDEDDDLPF